MDAYKCNGCKQYFDGRPYLTVAKEYLTHGEPPEYHLCSWDCLELLAKEKSFD